MFVFPRAPPLSLCIILGRCHHVVSAERNCPNQRDDSHDLFIIADAQIDQCEHGIAGFHQVCLPTRAHTQTQIITLHPEKSESMHHIGR